MPTPTKPTAAEVAAGVLRYDGPHDAERLLFAADVVAEILRTLANATQDAKLFEQPDEVAVLLGRLVDGLDCLPQIARQTATNVIVMAGRPGLRMDSLARPADSPLAHGDPVRAAMTSVTLLAEHVGPPLAQLTTVLRAVRGTLDALAIDYGGDGVPA